MKLDFTSDVLLRGPVWANAIDKLVGFIFETHWELYSLCVTIGMMFDEQIESEDMVPDGYTAEPKSVPRTMLSHYQHSSLISFMLQCAMITTRHLDLSEDERLEIAFKEDAVPNFNPMNFLTKFANAGVIKINNLISDVDPTETMEAIMAFLNDTYEKGVENVSNSEPLEFE